MKVPRLIKTGPPKIVTISKTGDHERKLIVNNYYCPMTLPELIHEAVNIRDISVLRYVDLGVDIQDKPILALWPTTTTSMVTGFLFRKIIFLHEIEIVYFAMLDDPAKNFLVYDPESGEYVFCDLRQNGDATKSVIMIDYAPDPVSDEIRQILIESWSKINMFG